MSGPALRHRLEHRLLRAAEAWLRRRSHHRARQAGRRLGRLARLLLPGRRRLVDANLALALPELDAGERRRIAYRCFEHYGATFAETFSIAYRDDDEVLAACDVTGWETVEQLLAEGESGGRGFFLMSAHFGSMEVLGHYLGLRLDRLALVGRPPNNPLLAEHLRQLRTRRGSRLIDKQGAGRRMLTTVRRGGQVALAIDQRVRPAQGVRVPFFGHDAWTTPVLAFLSIATGAPVVPIYCTPAPGEGYRIQVRSPIFPEGRGREAEIALTRRYLASVEDEVRRAPELWFWMHRRWRA